jgi:hypothetical protein
MPIASIPALTAEICMITGMCATTASAPPAADPSATGRPPRLIVSEAGLVIQSYVPQQRRLESESRQLPAKCTALRLGVVQVKFAFDLTKLDTPAVDRRAHTQCDRLNAHALSRAMKDIHRIFS